MSILNGKTVFITGASSGIGEACAERFAREGCRIIITARRQEILWQKASALEQNYRASVLPLVLDVRDRKKVEDCISGLSEGWRDIDILINNAGLARGLSKLYEDDPAAWEEMIDTNVKGLLYVTRAIVPGMVKRQCGHIINIGSISGHEAYPGGAVYCATKHAVSAITKSLRMDLVNTPVRVTVIDPGMVETNFSTVRFYGDAVRAQNAYRGFAPLNAGDIAEAVVFAASRPSNVVIAEMTLFPTAQASATIIHRRE